MESALKTLGLVMEWTTVEMLQMRDHVSGQELLHVLQASVDVEKDPASLPTGYAMVLPIALEEKMKIDVKTIHPLETIPGTRLDTISLPENFPVGREDTGTDRVLEDTRHMLHTQESLLQEFILTLNPLVLDTMTPTTTNNTEQLTDSIEQEMLMIPIVIHIRMIMMNEIPTPGEGIPVKWKTCIPQILCIRIAWLQ